MWKPPFKNKGDPDMQIYLNEWGLLIHMGGKHPDLEPFFFEKGLPDLDKPLHPQTHPVGQGCREEVFFLFFAWGSPLKSIIDLKVLMWILEETADHHIHIQHQQ